jgi:hypothetical protein
MDTDVRWSSPVSGEDVLIFNSLANLTDAMTDAAIVSVERSYTDCCSTGGRRHTYPLMLPCPAIFTVRPEARTRMCDFLGHTSANPTPDAPALSRAWYRGPRQVNGWFPRLNCMVNYLSFLNIFRLSLPQCDLQSAVDVEWRSRSQKGVHSEFGYQSTFELSRWRGGCCSGGGVGSSWV